MRYKESGVDIDAATRALARARAAIASTWGQEVASEVGNFGGLYRQPDGSYLVSSIDGVGTKLSVALAAGRVGGVGADLVNHCVNDILVQGAQPLFFLDYFATGRLREDHFVQVVEGMAQACRENGCALIGGETAEMPGIYEGADFDLAGCIVGRVLEEELLTGESVTEGMELWAWPSTGLHTNGFSLARRALLEGPVALSLEDEPGELGCSLADALLAVHRSYLHPVQELRRSTQLAALCHITGGGLLDNLPRVLPPDLAARIELDTWSVPPIFALIARRGQVSAQEMRRVFNLGVGMVAIVRAGADAQLTRLEEAPWKLGCVVSREGAEAVQFRGRHRGLEPE